MQDRSKMYRLAMAALLATAVAAPSASAMQLRDGSGHAGRVFVPNSWKMDMHASTVKRPASAQQDLRTENSIAPSRAAFHAGEAKAKMDLRTEAAADPSRAPEPPVGLPTWPVDPKPIVPASPQPVAGDGDGGDIEWPIAALALAGVFALAGAVAIAGRRLRPAH